MNTCSDPWYSFLDAYQLSFKDGLQIEVPAGDGFPTHKPWCLMWQWSRVMLSSVEQHLNTKIIDLNSINAIFAATVGHSHPPSDWDRHWTRSLSAFLPFLSDSSKNSFCFIELMVECCLLCDTHPINYQLLSPEPNGLIFNKTFSFNVCLCVRPHTKTQYLVYTEFCLSMPSVLRVVFKVALGVRSSSLRIGARTVAHVFRPLNRWWPPTINVGQCLVNSEPTLIWLNSNASNWVLLSNHTIALSQYWMAFHWFPFDLFLFIAMIPIELSLSLSSGHSIRYRLLGLRFRLLVVEWQPMSQTTLTLIWEANRNSTGLQRVQRWAQELGHSTSMANEQVCCHRNWKYLKTHPRGFSKFFCYHNTLFKLLNTDYLQGFLRTLEILDMECYYHILLTWQKNQQVFYITPFSALN